MPEKKCESTLDFSSAPWDHSRVRGERETQTPEEKKNGNHRRNDRLSSREPPEANRAGGCLDRRRNGCRFPSDGPPRSPRQDGERLRRGDTPSRVRAPRTLQHGSLGAQGFRRRRPARTAHRKLAPKRHGWDRGRRKPPLFFYCTYNRMVMYGCIHRMYILCTCAVIAQPTHGTALA